MRTPKEVLVVALAACVLFIFASARTFAAPDDVKTLKAKVQSLERNVQFLKAQVKLLRGDVKTLASSVAKQAAIILKLKVEKAELRLQVESLKHRAAYLKKKAAVDKADARERAKARHTYKFDNFPTTTQKDMQKTVGHRLYAIGEVASVDPNPDKAGEFLITIVDTSQKTGGIEMKWVGKRWVRLMSVLRVPESAALRLQRGDSFKAIGDIEKVEVTKWRAIGATGPKQDEVVRIYLRNAKVR